jgi:hypothetical protein
MAVTRWWKGDVDEERPPGPWFVLSPDGSWLAVALGGAGSSARKTPTRTSNA